MDTCCSTPNAFAPPRRGVVAPYRSEPPRRVRGTTASTAPRVATTWTRLLRHLVARRTAWRDRCHLRGLDAWALADLGLDGPTRDRLFGTPTRPDLRTLLARHERSPRA